MLHQWSQLTHTCVDHLIITQCHSHQLDVQCKCTKRQDTINFSHKNITRPTITHADKVMNAITDCTKAIKDINSSHGAEAMRQLEELTEQAIHQHPTIAKLFATPASTTSSVLRVQTTNLTSTKSVLRVHRTAPAHRLTRLMSSILKLVTRQIA